MSFGLLSPNNPRISLPIKISKHARLKPTPDDGLRILVTRYWLRGLRREAIDQWSPELAPSRQLLHEYLDKNFSGVSEEDRLIFHRDWTARYVEEMKVQSERIEELRGVQKEGGTISLLCACHDPEFCHRRTLKMLIEGSGEL